LDGGWGEKAEGKKGFMCVGGNPAGTRQNLFTRDYFRGLEEKGGYQVERKAWKKKKKRPISGFTCGEGMRSFIGLFERLEKKGGFLGRVGEKLLAKKGGGRKGGEKEHSPVSFESRRGAEGGLRGEEASLLVKI